MATLNAHICLELYRAARALNYSAKCQPCRVSYDPNELRVSSHERKRFPVHNQAKRIRFQLASAFWWFYVSKILEFADTSFFILRKKWSQLSFLHVYHHSSMFIICWIVVKWIPTGSSKSIPSPPSSPSVLLHLPPHSLCSCSDEFICAHHHVWILLTQCSGASPVPVSVVEALFNRAAAAAVCIRSGLGHSGHCKQVRISALAQLHGSGIYVIISLSLRSLLCAKVHKSIGRKNNRRKMR